MRPQAIPAPPVADRHTAPLAAIITLLLTAFLAPAAHAALEARLNGQAVYDTDRNITWLSDASYAVNNPLGVPNNFGRYTYGNALAWIAALNASNHLGSSTWRLPRTAFPDATCTIDAAGTIPNTDPNVPSGFNCRESEMGHLHYTELSAPAGPVTASTDPDLALFTNYQVGCCNKFYFSQDRVLLFGVLIPICFAFSAGQQAAFGNTGFVWPVMDGDIGGTDVILDLSKRAPDVVAVGQEFQYQMNVMNLSATQTAHGVVVEDLLPEGVSLVRVEEPQTCTGSLSGTQHRVSCVLGELAPGAGVFISFKVLAPATPGTIVNTASADSNQTGTPVESSAQTEVLEATVDLQISKQGPSEVLAGTEFHYYIETYNLRPFPASAITIRDPLPPGTTFLRAELTAGSVPVPCSLDTTGTTVECTATGGDDIAGAIYVTAGRVGPNVNTATISSPESEYDPANNTATAVVNVIIAAGTVTDSLNAPDDRLLDFDPTPPGAAAEGSIVVTNTGASPLLVGTLFQPLDPPFALLDLPGSPCLGTTLSPGSSCSLLVRFTPGSVGTFIDGFDLLLGGTVVPISVIGIGANPGGSIDLAVTKIADRNILRSTIPGENRVQFTITVTNRIREDIPTPITAGVVVKEKLPKGLRIPPGESATWSRGLFSPASGEWLVGDLAPGQSATLILPAVVDPSQLKTGGCLTNSVEVWTTTTGAIDIDGTNDTAEVKLAVDDNCADLQLLDRQQVFHDTLPGIDDAPQYFDMSIELRNRPGPEDCTIQKPCQHFTAPAPGRRSILRIKLKGFVGDPQVVVAARLREGSSPTFGLLLPAILPVVLGDEGEEAYIIEVEFPTLPPASLHEAVLEIVTSDLQEPVRIVEMRSEPQPYFGTVNWYFRVENKGPGTIAEPYWLVADLPSGASFLGLIRSDEIPWFPTDEVLDGLIPDPGDPNDPGYQEASVDCTVSTIQGDRERVQCLITDTLLGRMSCMASDRRCGIVIGAAVIGTSFSEGLDTTVCSLAVYDPALENNGPSPGACPGKKQ